MIVKKTGTNSFFKDFFTLGVGSFLYLIVGLIGTPIITRMVTPTDYGQMSIISVYSNIGLMFCGLGLDQTMVRYFYREENPDYQRKLLHSCYVLPMLLASVVSIVMLVSHFFGYQWLSFSQLLLLLINVIVLILHRYAMLLMRLRYHSKLYSTVNIIQKITVPILHHSYFYFIFCIYYNHFLSIRQYFCQ